MNERLNWLNEPDEVITIREMFHSESLHHNFLAFLSSSWQLFETLRIFDNGDHVCMVLSLRCPDGRRRQIGLDLLKSDEGDIIKTFTEVVPPRDLSVLQVVLMFTGSYDYPEYVLELQTDSRLMLCCRKAANTLGDEAAFERMILHLAHLAERLENRDAAAPVVLSPLSCS